MIRAEYIPTKKNKPCHDFWTVSGFTISNNSRLFTWDVSRNFPLPEELVLTIEA
jgi:predicted enzyme involved in methoxymalonyl-ACP biosynthesis